MSLLGFEPRIPVFERAKTVHALDREATVIGIFMYYGTEMKSNVVRTVQWTLLFILVTLQSVSPWLLGCCCRQLRRRCAHVFIPEHYFTSKLFAVIEVFSTTYPTRRH
jgi:hypothetical protein